jgi:hypothetical protein
MVDCSLCDILRFKIIWCFSNPLVLIMVLTHKRHTGIFEGVKSNLAENS